MRAMRLLLLLWLSSAPLEAQWWKVETSGIDTNLRSVSVARASNARGASPWVVWASGSHGVILESADEGKTWKRLQIGRASCRERVEMSGGAGAVKKKKKREQII